MEPLIYTHPPETPIVRFQREFGTLLWGLLEVVPQLTIRKYIYKGNEISADQGVLRLAALQSCLIPHVGLFSVHYLGKITDHLGIPFTNISFFKSGKDLNEIYGANYTITIGDEGKDTLVEFTNRRISTPNNYFLDPGVLIRAASLGPTVDSLKPGEYNPLKDDGRYVSKFQQSLGSRK